MTGVKIYHLFLVILTAQCILCNSAQYPTDELKVLEEMKNSANISQRLKFMIVDNLMLKPQKYITSAVNATKYLLKEETLQASNRPEVIEFKKNLTQYLDKNIPSMDNIQYTHTAMTDYAEMINQYFELSEKELTPETKLIIDLLNKYNCKDIAENMSNHYQKFLLDFSKMFEESKSNLEKPLLDWYDEFMKATFFHQKMALIINFLMMN